MFIFNFLFIEARDEIIRTNFENYNLSSNYWDIMAADATHSPFRTREIFDAIVTDRECDILMD